MQGALCLVGVCPRSLRVATLMAMRPCMDAHLPLLFPCCVSPPRSGAALDCPLLFIAPCIDITIIIVGYAPDHVMRYPHVGLDAHLDLVRNSLINSVPGSFIAIRTESCIVISSPKTC